MTAQVQLPADVKLGIRERWPGWADRVETELRELCGRHDAQPLCVLPARYSFVVSAAAPTGPLVVRASTDPMAPCQAQVAQALADLGIAPTIRDLMTADTRIWMVIDQVQPGTSLVDLKPPTPPIDALAATLRPMIGQSAPSNLPRLADWLRDRLKADNLVDAAPSLPPASPATRREALDSLDNLVDGSRNRGLCHGDTSWGNVLLGPAARFYLIDPRGMTGDVSYDAAVLALKSARLEAPETVADKLATRAGLDPEPTRAWLAIARAARV